MSIRESVLMEAVDDYVGLWSVAWEFREKEGEKEPIEIRRKTLETIKSLLEEELIQPGMFNQAGVFELWNLIPKRALERIESEWDALGREPTLGEIVWFVATEKGEEMLTL
jgi:hypothetical protein